MIEFVFILLQELCTACDEGGGDLQLCGSLLFSKLTADPVTSSNDMFY